MYKCVVLVFERNSYCVNSFGIQSLYVSFDV